MPRDVAFSRPCSLLEEKTQNARFPPAPDPVHSLTVRLGYSSWVTGGIWSQTPEQVGPQQAAKVGMGDLGRDPRPRHKMLGDVSPELGPANKESGWVSEGQVLENC